MTKQRAITASYLKDWVVCSDVSKKNGLFTFRSSYYYDAARRSRELEREVDEGLNALGLKLVSVESGEIYKSWPNTSYVWMRGQVVPK